MMLLCKMHVGLGYLPLNTQTDRGADAALCYMGAQWWFLRRWCLRLTGAWTLCAACLRTAHCRRIARAHGTAPSATARRRTDAVEGG
jgi:hypothetical protein